MEPAPLTPLGAHTHHAHPAYVPVVSALVGAIVVASYLIIANTTGLWPFTRPQTTEPVVSASPTSEIPVDAPAGWKVYQNDAGYAFAYPPTAQLSATNYDSISLSLAEGGLITVGTGMGTVGNNYTEVSDPIAIQVGPVGAQKYVYSAPGGCHGIIVVIPDGGEGDRDFLVSYDDCYVGGGKAGFPNAAQTAVFNQILSTFRTELIARATEKPVPPGTGWSAYSDDAHGFSFWFPDYYIPSKDTTVGFTPNEGGGILSVVVTEGQFTGTQTLYEGFATPDQLDHIQVNGHTVYKHMDGDAGCGGTAYFFPMPTSYVRLEFVDCEGFPGPGVQGDADAVVNSFTFAAAPGARPQKPPQVPWTRFSSQYFTLSFMVPPTLTVTDEPNDIKISAGPYEAYAIGSDNAFMHLRRYSSEYTKAAAEASFRRTNTDVTVSTINIDGVDFPYLQGIDNGSFSEGTSRGRAFLVLFNKSSLHSIATVPVGPENDYEFISSVILQTFRFSK